MRAVVQRVHQASVTVDEKIVGTIAQGLCVYVGVGLDDRDADLRYLADKIYGLRIFNDDQGKMNLSVAEVGGSVLLISAFALQGDARKGRRPSFDGASDPAKAKSLYEQLGQALAKKGLHVEWGVFRAHMDVASVNDGPICILLDSKKQF